MAKTGLDLSRGARRSAAKRRKRVCCAAVLALVLLLPLGLGAAPALAEGLYTAVGQALYPGFAAEQRTLQRQNAALRTALAAAAPLQAENRALRALLQSPAPKPPALCPARPLARGGTLLLVCAGAAPGDAVLDGEGRLYGYVVRATPHTAEAAAVGGKQSPAAGLAGEQAGLLRRSGAAMWLEGLPLPSALQEGAPVTTPEGLWLGTLAAAPAPQPDGLTARAPLTGTANAWDTMYFVAQQRGK